MKELAPEKLELVDRMLGGLTLKWDRSGVWFSGKRNPELEELVSLDMLGVEETQETWGTMFTYKVTTTAKKLIARARLV